MSRSRAAVAAAGGLKVKLRGTDVLGTRLRAHAEERIRLALARFADRIGEVVVRFSNDGEDHPERKRCEIDVALTPRRVRAADTDGDLLAAVDRAAARAARSVGRVLDQEHELAASQAGRAAAPPRGRAP